MSCGQIALKQLGIKVDTYYSSEIDKYAMQITQKNFPDTIQVGDICNLDPKDFMDVDLIQAGSPCQGFSFAGKQLAFDDPRSSLFFEFIRLLKAIKPKYFLLENVRMKKEFLEVITEQVSSCYTADDVAPGFKDMFGNVKFEPHFINASLVSAQSRQRYYWTNIPGVKQPEDRGIVLRDILETEPESITKMSDKFVKRNGDKNCMIDQDKEKAHNLSAEEYVKNGRQGNYLACDEEGKPAYKSVKKTERNRRHLRQLDEKSLCMTATMYKGAGNNGMTLVPNKPKKLGNIYPSGGQNGNVYSEKGKSPTLSAGQGDKGSLVVKGGRVVGRAYDKDGKRMDRFGDSVAGKTKQTLEVREDDKTNAITTVGKDSVVAHEDLTWRKLTPLECERLQTVPDNYTDHVSNTQRYKMLGNGWTVEVIKHIFKNMRTT